MRKSGEVFYKHSGMCVFEPSLLREHAMGLPKLSEHFNQTNSCRAVASMYSWGGGGGGCRPKNFRMTKKISKYFMAYEAMKMFAIRKMKMQFINKNTHSLRKDILQKHAVP